MTRLPDVTERERRRRRSARIDLALVAVVVVGGFVLASAFDLFELFSDWSRHHERYDADELAVAAVAAIIGLAVYSLRRYRDAHRDARELATAERALAETGERHRSLFEYNPQAVFSLGTDGRFTSANRAALVLSGYSEEELRTMSFTDLLCPEDLEDVGAAFIEILERRPQTIDTSVRRRDGSLVELIVTGLPIVVGDVVVGVFGIAEDVTERNRLLQQLEDARRAAEHANQAKSLFLANMSHEIRTPLTTVLAAAELLRDTELDAGQQRLTEAMDRAGSRLLRLVDEILDFSRVESGRATLERTDFDPTVLLADTTAVARAAASAKGLRFELVVDGPLPDSIHGDPVRVGQVVSNLLDNAVKFTETGFVRLEARASRLGDGRPELQVVVQDSGIGMTPEQTERVFESFLQADPSITRRYGGTGLGLAITKQLVELMGGSISVTSGPGAGTAFSVRLPLSAA
ncbi:PAS domain-containing sensor histidine kinase [Nocardioides sp. T2.26MG-1]|uniref:PAS domain-containing sensor histidine kinase n=1 Tax=Nocardioides sp. T2.26MG-1 TaxID=3041166 RepID=UPI00247734AE|nr:ATP-binding protein [Nocardioides sp. T2.26MG-1]CAI9398500.1 Sensor histidine kinase RcsC [Nocardioides sp. T2.26MG-1]